MYGFVGSWVSLRTDPNPLQSHTLTTHCVVTLSASYRQTTRGLIQVELQHPTVKAQTDNGWRFEGKYRLMAMSQTKQSSAFYGLQIFEMRKYALGHSVPTYPIP